MRTRTNISALAIALTAAAAFGAPAFAQSAQPTDGQIIMYVQTVDKAEIKDAKMEMSKGKAADTKDFAKKMVSDHTENMKVMASLAKQIKAKEATSPMTQALMAEGKQNDKMLASAKGPAFDKAYIDAQAKAHEEVADTIQNQLMPAAQNPQLKSALSDTLQTVKMHLQMARDISQKM